jgi:hypothetical protein
VALDGVSLEGIQWSARTRWPAEWMGQVKAASRDVEPGIFQMRRWSSAGRRGGPLYRALANNDA